MAAALAILALLAVAAFGKGKDLPCEPGVCTWAQIEAEERLETVPVDMGPHRDGTVTVEEP